MRNGRPRDAEQSVHIGPWSINSVAGDAVHIDGANLTYSFVLSNMTIAGNGAPTSRGIALVNINPSGAQTILAAVQGKATSIQTAGIGVSIANSSYVILDGGGANPNDAGVETGAGRINKLRPAQLTSRTATTSRLGVGR